MPVHSVTIVDAVFGAQDPELAGCWRLQHAADNGLVAGSSPPGPTTQSCTNPEFPVSAEHSRFSALWGRLMVRSRSLRETKTVRKRIWPCEAKDAACRGGFTERIGTVGHASM